MKFFFPLKNNCPPPPPPPNPRRAKTKIAFELILLFNVYFIGPCDMG